MSRRTRRRQRLVSATTVPRECRRWDWKLRGWVLKVRYSEKHEAEAEAQPGERGYRCGACGWWHVGTILAGVKSR